MNEEDVDQAVVFASTQEDTDMLAEELAEAGLSVVALHGAMPQTVRNRRLRSIREGRAKSWLQLTLQHVVLMYRQSLT